MQASEFFDVCRMCDFLTKGHVANRADTLENPAIPLPDREKSIISPTFFPFGGESSIYAAISFKVAQSLPFIGKRERRLAWFGDPPTLQNPTAESPQGKEKSCASIRVPFFCFLAEIRPFALPLRATARFLVLRQLPS